MCGSLVRQPHPNFVPRLCYPFGLKIVIWSDNFCMVVVHELSMFGKKVVKKSDISFYFLTDVFFYSIFAL